MKKWLALSVVMAVIGCKGDPATDVSNTSPVPAQPSASQTPTQPTLPVSSSTTALAPASPDGHKAKDVTAVPSANQTNTDPRTGADPNRINQLKDLKVVTLKANGHKIKAWVMDTESKRQEGMMFLQDKDVRSDEGMIFVFPDLQPQKNGFWMHNCPLGLDICYFDVNKKLLNIADGKPFVEDPVYATGDYQWVLEMKPNCAKNLGIKPGTPLEIPSGLKGTQ